MTKKTLMLYLNWLKINPNNYSFEEEFPRNKYVYQEKGKKQIIYFSEDSEKKEEKIFEKEEEALNYFLHFIAMDPFVRKNKSLNKFNNPLYDKNLIFSKETLSLILNELEILQKYYSLVGGMPEDQYVLSNEEGRWCVYHSEKGEKNNVRIFNSEEDACRYFLWYIATDPTIRK